MIEIAKLKVKEAILKMCRERNLGGGSYDRIIMELFLKDCRRLHICQIQQLVAFSEGWQMNGRKLKLLRSRRN